MININWSNYYLFLVLSFISPQIFWNTNWDRHSCHTFWFISQSKFCHKHTHTVGSFSSVWSGIFYRRGGERQKWAGLCLFENVQLTFSRGKALFHHRCFTVEVWRVTGQKMRGVLIVLACLFASFSPLDCNQQGLIPEGKAMISVLDKHTASVHDNLTHYCSFTRIDCKGSLQTWHANVRWS